MPWPKEHKTRTRRRIVQAAAAAFRKQGVSSVRLDEIMARAGLTHGGFYAHFDSKDDLVTEALDWAERQTVEILSGGPRSTATAPTLQAVIDTYLSLQHAAHPEWGCPVAAVSQELSRRQGEARRSLARTINGRLRWLRGLFSDRKQSVDEAELVGLLACMVGGMVLARAVEGKDSRRILQGCRQFLSRALGQPPNPRRPTARRRPGSPSGSRG